MSKEFKGTKAHTRYKLQDGTVVPGVTSVLGMLAKPALIHWAWKLGMEGVDYKKFRDKAADIGTLAHYLIQCELSSETPDLSQYSPEMLDKAENCLISWWEWKRAHTFDTILVEEKLVSETYRFGGTIDCLCAMDGQLTLLDFKTGKGIYDSMLVQLSAYAKLLEENGYKVKAATILNIGRGEDESFKTESITAKQIDEFWHGFFIPALTIYNSNKTIRRVV